MGAILKKNQGSNKGGASCVNHPTNRCCFEATSKRRKGFPSEAWVKKGHRVVHGNKVLDEKLGRNDPCPCGSGRLFQEMLSR
jgi:SEC-C motif